MDQALTAEQERQLDKEGHDLREMMKSDGWAVLSRAFTKTLAAYDTTRDITTVKELLARKDAIRMMNAWMEDLLHLVERLERKEDMRLSISRKISESGIMRVMELADE